MLQENLIDIDDYIYLPVKILTQNDYIRSEVAKRYQYIFVDEYQDINITQNRMLELITTDETFVMYVGDDDQSIYEFRGSKSSFILEKTSPKSDYDVFYLTVNFRSRKPIVDFSKQILSTIKDPERAKKEIVSNEGGGGQKPVRHKPFSTKEDEIRYVVDEIHRLITESSVEPREIAVLSRYSSNPSKAGFQAHPELHQIHAELMKQGIPTCTLITLERDKESARQIRRLCEILTAYTEPEFLPEYLNLLENNVYNSDRFAKLLMLINEKYHTDYSVDVSFTQLMDSIIKLNPSVEMASFQKRLEKYIRTYRFSIEQFRKVKKGAMPTEIISNIIAYLAERNLLDEEVQKAFVHMFNILKQNENDIVHDTLLQMQTIKMREHGTSEELKDIDRQIAEISEQSRIYTELYTQGVLDEMTFYSKADRLKNKITELRSRRLKVLNMCSDDGVLNALRKLEKVLLDTDFLMDFSGDVFDSIVEKIYVEQEGKLTFVMRSGLEFTMDREKL